MVPGNPHQNYETIFPKALILFYLKQYIVNYANEQNQNSSENNDTPFTAIIHMIVYLFRHGD